MRLDEIAPYARNARNNAKTIPAVAEPMRDCCLCGLMLHALSMPATAMLRTCFALSDACPSRIGIDITFLPQTKTSKRLVTQKIGTF